MLIREITEKELKSKNNLKLKKIAKNHAQYVENFVGL